MNLHEHDEDVVYEIPEGMKKLITVEFLTLFRNNLVEIFMLPENASFTKDYMYVESTAGWGKAFVKTCKELNVDELLNYYKNLIWYDGDSFDAILSELLIEHKIIPK